MAKPGSSAAREITAGHAPSRGGGIDTRELERICAEFESGALNPHEMMAKFSKEFPRALAKVRRQAGMQPVRINGSRRQGLASGYFEMQLRDGTLGYFQRRTDDCVQAVIASLLQMPPHLVPDLHVDQQRVAGHEPEQIDRLAEEKMGRWKAKYGIRTFSHATPPTWSDRWIGVVTTDDHWNDHVLLMSGSDCLFDPANLLPPGPDQPTALEGYGVADIDYGLTIERR